MSFQKYLDALTMMDEVIAVATDTVPATAAWDKLCTFLYANFISPDSAGNFDVKKYVPEFETEIEEMNIMSGKDRATLEEELRKIPPVIAEVAFPIYIARHLLVECSDNFDPGHLATFQEFHRRYGYMIEEGAIRHGVHK